MKWNQVTTIQQTKNAKCAHYI